MYCRSYTKDCCLKKQCIKTIKYMCLDVVANIISFLDYENQRKVISELPAIKLPKWCFNITSCCFKNITMLPDVVSVTSITYDCSLCGVSQPQNLFARNMIISNCQNLIWKENLSLKGAFPTLCIRYPKGLIQVPERKFRVVYCYLDCNHKKIDLSKLNTRNLHIYGFVDSMKINFGKTVKKLHLALTSESCFFKCLNNVDTFQKVKYLELKYDKRVLCNVETCKPIFLCKFGSLEVLKLVGLEVSPVLQCRRLKSIFLVNTVIDFKRLLPPTEMISIEMCNADFEVASFQQCFLMKPAPKILRLWNVKNDADLFQLAASLKTKTRFISSPVDNKRMKALKKKCSKFY